jgi:hypothetical protein
MVLFPLFATEMTQMLYSGAWGKMIHEKNPKQKSPDTVFKINRVRKSILPNGGETTLN